mgnify:CR=1 FL=1
MGVFDFVLNIYDKQYKKLMLLPLALLILSLIVLGVSYATRGEFVAKGVSLKGGITLTFEASDVITLDAVETALASAPGDITVRGISEGGRLSSVIIEASDITEKDIVASLQAAGISLAEGSYSVENIGASIGTDFFRQTLYAVIGAFLGIALVVYITFRSFVPSAFAVQAVVSTMIMTLATINLLGVRLSTGGIAAFLMLIGYSIDTDILLTSRVLKNREGDIFQRILGATKTGLTMTLTAAAATTVGFLFTQSDTIKQIMLILTIGLVYDIINTWCNNASVLRWYLEKKGGRNG